MRSLISNIEHKLRIEENVTFRTDPCDVWVRGGNNWRGSTSTTILEMTAKCRAGQFGLQIRGDKTILAFNILTRVVNVATIKGIKEVL